MTTKRPTIHMINKVQLIELVGLNTPDILSSLMIPPVCDSITQTWQLQRRDTITYEEFYARPRN